MREAAEQLLATEQARCARLDKELLEEQRAREEAASQAAEAQRRAGLAQQEAEAAEAKVCASGET